MLQRRRGGFIGSMLVVLVMLALSTVGLWAQGGSRGTIAVSVVDPSGYPIPGAKLTLVDVKTNDTRTASSLDNGVYTFNSLAIGAYDLKVEMAGFESLTIKGLIAKSIGVNNIEAKLKVGSAETKVDVVGTSAPLVETSSNTLGQTIDLKQINDLPLSGRSVKDLVNYTAGNSDGIFNGQRGASQSNTIDGVVASSSRMKDGGNATPAASPRIENIEEVSVQTAQLDLNQGYGQANTSFGFITKRGGNQFHGAVYGDFQNSGLNAMKFYDRYVNDNYGGTARKAKYHKTAFGGSVGGPIIKDKLFFFASLSYDLQPGQASATNLLLNNAAQAGDFTYAGTDGSNHTVNVYTLAASLNKNLPTTMNAKIKAEMDKINTAVKLGSVSAYTGGDALNVNQVSFKDSNNLKWIYPTIRLDYNLNAKTRINFAYNQTNYHNPGGVGLFPGAAYNSSKGKIDTRNYVASLGVDYAITSTLLNQFRGGFLYTYSGNTPASGGTSHLMDDCVWWNTDFLQYNSSGDVHAGWITNYYPQGSISDNLIWQKGKHGLTFSFSGYREQDHYWNNPLGYHNIVFGALSNTDPAYQAFLSGTMAGSTSTQQTMAGELYALLTGRLQTDSFDRPNDGKGGWKNNGAVNLDERQQAWGLSAQDSWRILPNLTLNYGLRWDFVGDAHDLKSMYYSASKEDLYGPSGYGNLFNPGSFKGSSNPVYAAKGHAYSPWHKTPQPAFGLAWTPGVKEGWLAKLTGGDKTTLRLGYALRNYTESYQNFWNYASNQGSFFYQSTWTSAGQAGVPGSFAAGSYSWGDNIPSNYYTSNPTTQSSTISMASQAFINPLLSGMDNHIKQPYIQSWNFGLQRELNSHNAIEVRYVGNRSIHEWLPVNINEVNIVENGFLSEFKNAQKNLQINNTHGVTSFANLGYAGESALPIMSAAFAGEGLNSGAASDFTNSMFINYLNQGQAGAFAGVLSGVNGTANYFCNMVGANNFSPCATNAGYTGAGAGYASNFWQANPYYAGNAVGYLSAVGYSNYNSLQAEYHVRNWHGANFNANYTFGKNLGILPTRGNDASNFTQVTLRNLRMNYRQSDSDARHTLNFLGTYDLPFGAGKAFASSSKIVNGLVGGWTVGSITTWHSGLPIRLYGGYETFNTSADGGVVLNGISKDDLKNAFGRYKVGKSFYFINPKYLTNLGSSSAYIKPNDQAGVIGYQPTMPGFNYWNEDLSLSKRADLPHGMKFSLQAEFLNAFNHHNWYAPINAANFTVTSTSFGKLPITTAGSRSIELRVNLEF